jgi:hypothetical protein
VHVPQEFTVRLTPQLSSAVTVPQFFPSREQNVAFDSGPQPSAPNIWISASCKRAVEPLFAVNRKRYCWYAVVLLSVYVLVWKRAAPANCPVRVSSVTQPVPEPAVHVPWQP